MFSLSPSFSRCVVRVHQRLVPVEQFLDLVEVLRHEVDDVGEVELVLHVLRDLLLERLLVLHLLLELRVQPPDLGLLLLALLPLVRRALDRAVPLRLVLLQELVERLLQLQVLLAQRLLASPERVLAPRELLLLRVQRLLHLRETRRERARARARARA